MATHPQHEPLDIKEQIARIDNILRDHAKMDVEMDKLLAESRKLVSESRKLDRETTFYPFIAGAGVFAAAVAFMKLFLH